MKTAIIILVILIAGTVHSASYEILSLCKEATATRDRVAKIYHPDRAAECVRQATANLKQQELIESQIRLNNAKAEWYEKNKHRPDFRGFPCSQGDQP